jgi:hypothetical protein
MKITMDGKYTSNGEPVRILCVDAAGDFRVVALVGGKIEQFTAEGVYDKCRRQPSIYDLKPVKTKREGWVNVYLSDSGSRYVAGIWDTAEEARAAGKCSSHYVATDKFKWEE